MLVKLACRVEPCMNEKRGIPEQLRGSCSIGGVRVDDS